jgi:hypothetical protein
MRLILSPLLIALIAVTATAAEPPQVVPVVTLAETPGVDGNLSEWGGAGWVKVPIKPSVSAADRVKLGLEAEDKNVTGSLTLQIKVGVFQDRVFLALRWPDDTADVDYKGWDWNGTKYVESGKREDMLAVRFNMDGEFDRSMLSGKTYKVDLWLWSAARTNPSGLAEDWMHLISTKMIEDAAEYEVNGVGTVYIKKIRDSGNQLFKTLRPPKEKGSSHTPSFEMLSNPSGSVADVSARGVWKAGYWNLEFSRKLNTGNADDLSLRSGLKAAGQIAVFNRGSSENKSISEPLVFDFSGIK